jgi:hypothetical protein
VKELRLINVDITRQTLVKKRERNTAYSVKTAERDKGYYEN